MRGCRGTARSPAAPTRMQPDPIVAKLCYQVNIGNFWGGVWVLGRQNMI